MAGWDHWKKAANKRISVCSFSHAFKLFEMPGLILVFSESMRAGVFFQNPQKKITFQPYEQG